ncbi:MAG: 16S rRNA (guanine(527)-N(7))-methyltransferase RsmG [Pyrinomonadaceae bacterium]
MSIEFVNAIKDNQEVFGVALIDEAIDRLAMYYELILQHNQLLHLIAPMPAEEFAVRHVLESLTMLQFLRPAARFIDVGSGGGLPAAPCLLVRNDLRAVLVESKEKKAAFLSLVAEKLDIGTRTQVLNRQFSELDPRGTEAVSCRALDKFTQKLPQLVKWAGKRQLLLFGGPNLRDALQVNGVTHTEKLMPLSEKRYLFISNPD